MGFSVNMERFRKKGRLALASICMYGAGAGVTSCGNNRLLTRTICLPQDGEAFKTKDISSKAIKKTKIKRIIFIHSEGSPLMEQNHKTEVSQTELKGVFRLLVLQFSIQIVPWSDNAQLDQNWILCNFLLQFSEQMIVNKRCTHKNLTHDSCCRH